MKFKHQTIDASLFQRVFVIGDIHGKLGHFKHTLASIAFDPSSDLLIAVGDLIDRGPQSAETLRFFFQSDSLISITGNHEQMMSKAMSVWDMKNRDKDQQRMIDIWFKNGGDWALYESRETLASLQVIVETMPSVVTCHLADGRKVGISHAQPHSLHWREMQNWEGDMFENPRWIWGRTRIKNEPPEPVHDVDFTIHGHTKSENVVQVANSYFIDTASENDYAGAFTMFELNENRFFKGTTLTEWQESGT